MSRLFCRHLKSLGSVSLFKKEIQLASARHAYCVAGKAYHIKEITNGSYFYPREDGQGERSRKSRPLKDGELVSENLVPTSCNLLKSRRCAGRVDTFRWSTMTIHLIPASHTQLLNRHQPPAQILLCTTSFAEKLTSWCVAPWRVVYLVEVLNRYRALILGVTLQVRPSLAQRTALGSFFLRRSCLCTILWDHWCRTILVVVKRPVPCDFVRNRPSSHPNNPL